MRRSFETQFVPGLPPALQSGARLAFYRRPTPDERRIADEIEGFREGIRAGGEGATARAYASPHSGTFEVDERGHALPGTFGEASLEAHAKTGVDPMGGLLLRRIVDGMKAADVLELGTNTGLSGCYFLSAGARPELVTIEGSEDLCVIAESNLARMSGSFTVMNCLFDEALDQLAASRRQFACAFVDGQHERMATLRYADRIRLLLRPGGAIVFDDIRWSHDMHEAWKTLISSGEYAVTCDFGVKGVCFVGDGGGPPIHFDVGRYAGRPPIFRKVW